MLITPIVFAVISLLNAMVCINPVALTVPFAIADVVASFFYMLQPIPASYGEVLECSVYNKWIKLSHLFSDVTMIVFHLYFLIADGYVPALVLGLDVPYLIGRLFSQIVTTIALGKFMDNTKPLKRLPLHVILHLIPIVDICSAYGIDRQLNKKNAA